MTACNFRSLLFAVIVLSNCVTWTATRHHYTHNVHQHRTRHRRQGAGLFLSASYVIPGGEGSGVGWGEWGEVSPCSRTCGGGVASQKRICLQIGPDGQPQCSGGDTKYFSCQTQDCPSGSLDFRAEQCSKFDDKDFRGYKYNWVPYTKAPNPCELNCMPHGERFYFRHKSKVTDGTRCNDESFDVCVDGKCQPVGCDMMLGSNAREDKCRECRGNGANCHTTGGIFDSQDLVKGYNDILLIPQGSTTIIIEEIEPSNNYLALRAKNGTYYLNGHYHIDFPRNIMIAGALWTYERSQQGYAAPDKLRCLGPTNEPLYLSLLLQDVNVGIKYEYSVPNNSAPPTDKQYNWVHEEFTPCSATCGGGFQTRNVTCRSREELDVVDDNLCDEGLKPPTNQSCSPDPCPAQWVEGPWGNCSKRCGSDGVRSREVNCQKIIANGQASLVADKECFDLHGPKPELFQECNKDAPCPTWFIGHWKPCDKLCDEGVKKRDVICYQKKNGRIEILADEECADEKPTSEETCMLQPCDVVDWVTSDWSGCDNCLSKVRTRVVMCVTKGKQILNDSYCSYHTRPVEQEECEEVPPCDVQWYATQWSKCSVECGEGVQTRKVFCGLYDGENVTVVEDAKCADLPRYNDTKPCSVSVEDCPLQWFAGPWSKCSKKCDTGEQHRTVMCLRGNVAADGCDFSNILDPSQTCNTQPCNEDETLPVDSKSTTVMDEEDEECEDYEDMDYKEVGLEEGVTSDMAMSDDPSSTYAEFESTLSTEGSGDGSTLSTEDLIFEGSGSTSGSTFTIETDYTTEDTASTDINATTISAESTDDSTTKTTIALPTESTDETESTSSGETETTEISTTDVTGSTDTDETSSTDETSTDESTTEGVSTSPKSTESTETEITTEFTGSTSTDETGTEETGSTESSATDTEATETTDLSGSTSSTDETGSSETDESTVSTVTEETGSTESTVTEETGSTESTETTESTSETGTTETELDTEETSSSGTTEETGSTSTDSSSTVSEESTDKTTKTTNALPTEESSTTESTDFTGSTESTAEVSTTESESTSDAGSSTIESSTTESGSTISSVGSESTTFEETGSTESTEASSTISSESTFESSTSSGSDSTLETSESSASSESTTESGSTTEGSSTVSGETESSDVSGSTTEGSTTESGSTDESSTSYSTTEVSESTFEGLSTTEGSSTEGVWISTGSTIWDFSTTIGRKKKPFCKPRKPKCKKSQFGCCPDKKTPASGPFDKGCPERVRTCKQTEHGCCPDGVSPAGGKNNEGCPVEPCVDTLFGCCLSDNKTIAQGNDQDGCPPPPPACASSKFGCCADNDTEATGPNKKGCPETETTTTEMETETTETTEYSESSEGSSSSDSTTEAFTDVTESCSGSKFGCCFDNVTVATGPDGDGCPCESSEFGCCPDGVSPAQGVGEQGCPGPCSTSAYGCCQDEKTPAHGPDFEGCCLLTAFGCCPDNRKPAEGPHLEGCGCQYAPYGCCPDNVTIAQGPDNQGCGCQYTQHGCCPDRHTEASGPNNEGCGCNTYQFGCCPDGITIAKGPEKQGCHCRDSKFGCCSDDETPASGPDAAGCDCSSSRHGCCPDGHTEATGPKFLGCTDAPVNKQAVCTLSTDPGPCHDFTAMWFYDIAYGGCSRFWYGGCDGNGNRFATKEECEDICVQPPPKDACKLPSIKGPCEADYVRWHYNSTREQCIPFRYGGCLGNANNFDTRELCQTQCEPDRTTEQCNLPIEAGSCAGNYSRWGYNMETHRCEPFTWGGCEGNSNKFGTEAACQMRCNPPGALKPQCTEPLDAGNCTEKEALWSFSQSENRCVPFYYSGCGGNHNRFQSRQSCEQTCPSAYVPDKCTLPPETGDCANYREKWFYDTSNKRCRQFYYGGCGGNENNFGTEAECEHSCTEVTITTTTIRPTQPQSQPEPQQPPQEPERPDFCLLSIEAGPCTSFETRFAYDSDLGRCTTFQYGGCGGNQNNFPSDEYCSYYCHPVQDVCQLPMMTGSCDDSVMRWFYDPSTDSCSLFSYSGCGGNDNSFDSRDACESRCRSGPAQTTLRTTMTTPTTTVSPVDALAPECRISESFEECSYSGVVWYLDQESRECVAYMNKGSGSECRVTGAFRSPEACERSCGAFRGVDVCAQRVDPGPCRAYIPKIYFDAASGECKQFAYGGCLGGANRFSTVEECSDVCKAQTDICQLPPEQGNCISSIEQWYYDASQDQCAQFIYTGCSGNDNRFATQQDCEARCKRPSAVTTNIPPQQSSEPECITPSSLQPCGANVTTFYFDSTRRECLAGDIGGCGLPNSYVSEEECERRCGAFRGLDVCGAPLDPGPCRASFTKYFWDSVTGSCEQFAFGGCAGGPNRFSTIEECQNVCGSSGPDNGEANCEMLKNECEALICQYGIERVSEDGCERCKCIEDPCVTARCSASERCVAIAVRDPNTSEPQYSARCVPEQETNEVLDCEAYVQECSRLRCEYGVQRTRAADGCERCACVPREVDCAPLRDECARLKCHYELERTTGPDGCERCKCKEHPCANQSCASGERCVVTAYRDAFDVETKYTADCRPIVKAGVCPADDASSNDSCRRECNDDADCRGAGKCCRRGCSYLCAAPDDITTSHSLLTTTYAPEVPAPPQVIQQEEPEVVAAEGGMATLRCRFHGNPPPKITWRRGELTIDGSVSRYRLTSDGALEIVFLYRNDTGVYICVAENLLGTARQEVQLVVNDPVRTPVGIAGDENAVLIGELGKPLAVRCLAYGYPQPNIFWYRGVDGAMVPYNDAIYEARGNVLLIRSLAVETLGEYTCQAYNGEGKAASWVVTIQAYIPEGVSTNNEYLVPRYDAPPAVRPLVSSTKETTTTTTTTTEPPIPMFTVPVSAHVKSPYSTLNIGAEVRVTCEVDGFPDPEVRWTKDGVPIQPDERTSISGSTIVSRLTIQRVTVADSGLYACHASNAYSSSTDTAQINVQQLIVPLKCTDNPFFANCDLIVRSRFCRHKYYSTFCCKSCVEAGQLDPQEAENQADQPFRRK